MKIAVLGLGKQGWACALDLLREPDVEGLLLLDADGPALERARERFGSDARVRIETVDAADESALAARLSGIDVVASAVPYFLNLGVTKAAIRARCSMTDMGGNTEVVFQQRSLDEKAKEAGIAVVPDLGLAPGLGNILAAHAIEGMDPVEEVRIRCGGLPLEPEGPLGYALFFSIHGLLNEYSGESVCLREGRIARIPTLTEGEWIRFPEPVGLCRAMHTSGGTSTLPWTLEGRVRRLDYKTVRYPGHWPKIRFLKSLGMLDTRPARFGRVTLPPREIAASLLQTMLDRPEVRDVVVLRVTARGRHGDHFLSRRFDVLEVGDPFPGASAMMKLTAFPTAAVALALARRTIQAKGVLAAESAVDAKAMLSHLGRRGIAVTVEETTRHGGSKGGSEPGGA